MTNKELFEDIVSKNIKRNGIDNLMGAINNTDFYVAPASTRFHDSEEGGLVKHSIKVYNILSDDLKDNELGISNETISIVSLFHDLCKMGFYKTDYRNTKNESGQWIKVPYYTVEDAYPYGHGEKSVDLLRDFIPLTLEEKMAIRWHMGGFEAKENYNYLSTAMSQYPLIIYLHSADLKASYIQNLK